MCNRSRLTTGAMNAVLGLVLLGVSIAAAAESASKIEAAPHPREFAFTLNNGYGQGITFPTDPAAFENLLINMKRAGFNTIYCVYKDWRFPLRAAGVELLRVR